jgi:hypothetical protein
VNVRRLIEAQNSVTAGAVWRRERSSNNRIVVMRSDLVLDAPDHIRTVTARSLGSGQS